MPRTSATPRLPWLSSLSPWWQTERRNARTHLCLPLTEPKEKQVWGEWHVQLIQSSGDTWLYNTDADRWGTRGIKKWTIHPRWEHFVGLFFVFSFFYAACAFFVCFVVVVANRFQMQFAWNLVHKFKVRVLVHVLPVRKLSRSCTWSEDVILLLLLTSALEQFKIGTPVMHTCVVG